MEDRPKPTENTPKLIALYQEIEQREGPEVHPQEVLGMVEKEAEQRFGLVMNQDEANALLDGLDQQDNGQP